MASSRNPIGNHTIDNVGNYVEEWWQLLCLVLQIFSGIVFLFTVCLLVEGTSTLYDKKDYIGCLLGLVLIIIFTFIGLGFLITL